VITGFLADCEGRLKPNTVRGYRDFLSPFARLARYGTMKADRLTAKDAEAYARKASWSNSTRHDFLSALAIAFRWAKHPLLGLKKPPMESRGDKALVSEDNHARLLEAAADHFKPFLCLLRLTGARPGEVAAFHTDNFDGENGVVRLKEHKTAHSTGKPRLVFLPAEAVSLLKTLKAKHGTGHLLRNHKGEPYTKNAIVRQFSRLRKRTGIKGATAYCYRHTLATDALAAGIPDAHVAALLGHSGTTMLHRHYSHLTEKAQTLKDALGKVRGQKEE
jgi:integrase